MSQLIRSNSVKYKVAQDSLATRSESLASNLAESSNNEMSQHASQRSQPAGSYKESVANAQYQKAFEEGFQQGLDKGKAEGLEQGLERGADEAKDKFLNEGFEQGFIAGKKEVAEQQETSVEELDKLKTELQEKLETLTSVTKELEALNKQAPQIIEDSSIQIALAALSQFLVTKNDDQELISQIVEKCVQKTWSENISTIKLSIRDHERLQVLVKDNKLVTHIQKLTFDVDPHLKSGDCIVETQSGELHSILTDQLALIVDQLLNVNAK